MPQPIEEYRKQRKRISDIRRRLQKEGYEIVELEELIKKPKKITEGTIRRLSKITPQKLRKKYATEEQKEAEREKRKEKRQVEHQKQKEKREAKKQKIKEKEKVKREKQKEKEKERKQKLKEKAKEKKKQEKAKKKKPKKIKEKPKPKPKPEEKPKITDYMREPEDFYGDEEEVKPHEPYKPDEDYEYKEDEEEQIQEAEEAIEALHNEIADIIDYSMADGKHIKDGAEFNMHQLVDSAVNSVGVQNAARNIENKWTDIQEALFFLAEYSYDEHEFTTGMERLYALITSSKITTKIAKDISKNFNPHALNNFYNSAQINSNEANLQIKDDKQEDIYMKIDDYDRQEILRTVNEIAEDIYDRVIEGYDNRKSVDSKLEYLGNDIDENLDKTFDYVTETTFKNRGKNNGNHTENALKYSKLLNTTYDVLREANELNISPDDVMLEAAANGLDFAVDKETGEVRDFSDLLKRLAESMEK